MHAELSGELSSEEKKEALQQKLANNPVYRAFENVHDVDDLYRIADLWLNPAATASRALSS